jgi:hypothetical protein
MLTAQATGGLDGTSADAASHLQLLSAKELWEYWVKCAKLQEEIVERNHKGRQGRRTADDSVLRDGQAADRLRHEPVCPRCAQP